MNIVGLFSIIIIFGTLIFQMFFFGHIIGPLVFTVTAAILIKEVGEQERTNQIALNVIAFVIASNLFYSWASVFGLYQAWIVEKNLLVMLHIGLGLVFGICFSFPLRKQVPIMYLVVYGLGIIAISVECTPELVIGALVLNAFILIWGYWVKDNRLLYAMVVFIIVSNSLYFLLPRMQGEGINFIFKVANQYESINQVTLVIHLSRLAISIITGFSLTIIAKRILFKDVQNNYRQSPLIATFLTVAVLSVLCAAVIYYQSQQYNSTIVFEPPGEFPVNLYSLPNPGSLMILSLNGPQVLWKLGETRNGFIQVVTSYGIRGWIQSESGIIRETP